MFNSCILIHDDLPEIDLIKKSIKSNINILEDDIPENINRIGIMFHNKWMNNIPFLIDTNYMYKQIYKKIDENIYKYFSNDLLRLFERIRCDNDDVFIVDIISCNIYDETFINEINKISNEMNIKINYSIYDIGNNKNSSWILSSSNENLLDIYFTEDILDWNYTLDCDNNIILRKQQIVDFFNSYSNNCMYYYSNTYYLNNDVYINTIDGAGNYIHIELSDNEIFDGNYHSIYALNNTNGLFVFNVNNHYSDDHKSIVKHLSIKPNPYDSTEQYVTNNSSFVMSHQKHFKLYKCKNYMEPDPNNINCISGLCGVRCLKFEISHCINYSVNSTIDTGGICGSYCKEFIIDNCENNNQYVKSNSGGICGTKCRKFSIIYCVNKAIIGDDLSNLAGEYNSAGICGSNCDEFKIINCINKGDFNSISNNYLSGIVGIKCSNFFVDHCINYGLICTNNIKNSTYVSTINTYNSGIIGSYSKHFEVTDSLNVGEFTTEYCSGITGNNCSNFKLIFVNNNCINIYNNCNGLIGNFSSDFKLYDCYNNCDLLEGCYTIGKNCFSVECKKCINKRFVIKYFFINSFQTSSSLSPIFIFSSLLDLKFIECINVLIFISNFVG